MNNQTTWAPGMTLEQVERAVILAAYHFYHGVKTTTARSLGISVRTLDAKLELYYNDDKSREERSDRLKRERDEFQLRQRGILPPARNTAPSGLPIDAGLRVEPAPLPPAQPPVSLPERAEIQEVPPKQAAVVGARRAR